MRISLPSLEINWLKFFPKDVILPDIVVIGEHNYDYGGCYYKPEWAEICVEGRNYSLEKGLIVVRDDQDGSTLAHEFRHHLQRVYYGIEFPSQEFNFDIPYKDAIIKYFTSSWIEMDALLYELSKKPTDTNLEWYEWIVKEKES